MEKRRRARINNCLNELKTLILDAMKKDVSTNFFLGGNFSIHLFINVLEIHVCYFFCIQNRLIFCYYFYFFNKYLY